MPSALWSAPCIPAAEAGWSRCRVWPTARVLMPCGRCRQVLLEHGGPGLLIDHPPGPRPLRELLPDAFGPDDLARRDHDPERKHRDAVHVRCAEPDVASVDAPTVIRTKRDGGELSDDAIDWVIDAYTHGRVADEQMSALLMAIFLRGMTTPRSPAGPRRWSIRASGWTSPIFGATASRWRWWTSIPPAGSATRSPSPWCPS